MTDHANQSMLVHNVFFTLKDGTAENIQKLTDAWLKRTSATDAAARKEATHRALTTITHTLLNSAGFLYID